MRVAITFRLTKEPIVVVNTLRYNDVAEWSRTLDKVRLLFETGETIEIVNVIEAHNLYAPVWEV